MDVVNPVRPRVVEAGKTDDSTLELDFTDLVGSELAVIPISELSLVRLKEAVELKVEEEVARKVISVTIHLKVNCLLTSS